MPYRERLLREKPMLLHPCFDQPDAHLRFDEDGVVHGLTERGSLTIAVLDLNRMQLVEERVNAIWRLLSLRLDERAAAIEQVTPYSAAMTHAMQSDASEIFREELKAARAQQHDFDLAVGEVATDKGEGLAAYKDYAHYIERVELRNVGPFVELDLDLLAPDREGTPAFALLGENGIGKSTILRAIACVLAGRSYARHLKLTSNSFLAAGREKGSIMVRLTGYPKPLTVGLRRGKPLDYGTHDAKTLVLAYGASRLLAAGRHKAEEAPRHAKIRNLFDPFVPVGDASSWLDTVAEGYRDDVRATLEPILNDEPEGAVPAVVVTEEGLRFAVGGAAPMPVASLSDGYKSLIGLAGDIMAVMHEAEFDKMPDAMGIVLIDELGNHFHPQLKLRIVGALRKAFPNIQFIYSTHEPLCLRGMTSQEVAVLRRDEEGVYVLTHLPDVATMRIDQLLASEHFGLGSTLDPERVVEIRRYHALVRKADRSADEDVELRALQDTLTDTEYLGGTRRERMLLSLLDMHPEKPVRTPGGTVNAAQMGTRTLGRLRQILQAVGPAAVSRKEST